MIRLRLPTQEGFWNPGESKRITEDKCLTSVWILLLMKETSLVRSSEYRLTASLLTLSNTSGDPSCWVQGCCSRFGDSTAVVEVIL